MKLLKLTALYTCLFVMLSAAVYAQGPGFDDDTIDEVPLDGGVSALIVAGVAYGAKKIKDAKQKNK